MSAPKLCEQLGISYTAYLDLEHMRASPFEKDEEGEPEKFRALVLKLAKFYSLDPWSLFPPSVLDVETPKLVKTVDSEELKQLGMTGTAIPLLPPAEQLEDKQSIASILDLLPTLPQRERYALTRYYGLDGEDPANTSAIAEELKVSHSRASQILIRSERRIRSRLHSTRCMADRLLEADAKHAEKEKEKAERERKTELRRIEEGYQKLPININQDKHAETYRCSRCSTQIRAFRTTEQKILPYCPKCNAPRAPWGSKIETFVFTTDMILDMPFKNEADLHAALRGAHHLD